MRPSASAATSSRSFPTASTRRRPRSTTTACAKASRCRSTPRSRSTAARMTIDLSGCSARAQGRHQLAHARRRARRLQGADRPARSGQRRLVPRARRDHSRRQHHDGALSGADGGLERDRADGRRHHRRGAGAGDARSRAGRRITACSAARSCSSASIPKTGRRFVVQSIEGGGWGGRPYEDGESARSRSARATCATARSKASS